MQKAPKAVTCKYDNPALSYSGLIDVLRMIFL